MLRHFGTALCLVSLTVFPACGESVSSKTELIVRGDFQRLNENQPDPVDFLRAIYDFSATTQDGLILGADTTNFSSGSVRIAYSVGCDEAISLFDEIIRDYSTNAETSPNVKFDYVCEEYDGVFE